MTGKTDKLHTDYARLKKTNEEEEKEDEEGEA